MKLRNPWIDPRIAQVSPEDIQAYLVQHGWKKAGPASNPNLLRYEVADSNEDAPTLFVPPATDQGPALEWMIELVGDLAIWQGRYAGDLLTDILHQGSPRQVNGAVPAPSP